MRSVLTPEPTAPRVPGPRPSFSAVVAAYQAAPFIGDAIESLLAQTLLPVEVIVCDDGSTDDLQEALAPYAARIVLLRQENRGPAAARNTAARAASGDFLAVLDADDVYFPERLEALAELSANRPDLDILTTDCRIVFEGRIVRNCYGSDYRFAADDQRRAILEENFVGPGHMAVRRERFLAVGGFDESFRQAEDWDCWIRMILSGSRVGLVDEPLAEYRIRPPRLASDRVGMLEGRIAVLEKTAGREDLSQDERAVVERSLAAQRRRLRLRRAEDALAAGCPGGRRLALDVARDSGFPYGTRARAAVAALVPRLAGKRLARGGRELAAGIRV
jgi:glycosyltransferase involved in cell wall biosynthesis